MSKVLIADKLHSAGVELLQNTPGIEVVVANKPSHEELCELVKGADAVLVRSTSQITEEVLDAGSALKVVGRAGIGVDNIDVTAASRRGVLVMNASGGNSITTAEHAIAMMMSLARKIPQATMSMKSGRWEKSRFMGVELYEHTLGVVGLGNIGRLVAERARGLGMNVIASDPYTSVESAQKIGVELVQFDDLLKRSQFISIHAPLNRETRGLFDERAFSKMTPGVLLVHCARGGIINESALLDALEKKIVAGAALDVFETEPPPSDHPLLTQDDVICTPHLGASTSEAQEKVALEIVQQLIDFLLDGTIRNALNLPSVRGQIPEAIRPYLDLGYRLGRFQAHAMGGFKEVHVDYAGNIFSDMPGLQLITNSVLKGLMSTVMDVPVNLVNAPILAAEQGLVVKESRSNASGTFTNLMSVRLVQSDETSKASGTLFHDEEARLVRLNGMAIEAPLHGELLLVHNEDMPGVIGNVGTVLGSNQVNVNRLHVGLNKKEHQAIAIWCVDQELSDDIIHEIGSQPHVRSVRSMTL